MAQQFNILIRAENFANYIFDITDKCPKKTRSDLTAELRKKALFIIELLIRANSISLADGENLSTNFMNRYDYQQECLLSIRIIESFIELAANKNYITQHQFETSTKLSFELTESIKK